MIINDESFNRFTSAEEVRSFYGIIKESEESEETPTEEKFTYADLKQKPNNIFEHIIVFTNSKDTKSNKTLKNIVDAVKELKKAKCDVIPTLHLFVAGEVTYVHDNSGVLSIKDSDEEFVFKKEYNTNTLVFSRLGVQGEEDCEHIVEMLQDRGFLVLNPVRYSELASNKYDTAELLQKAELPQPNFCLMNKDILYDEKLYKENMQKLYKDWSDDQDKNEEFSIVTKILDGHGGTGVFICDGKKIYAILQTLFAVAPNLNLILQKKEEADGGDIRVHVLTLRNKQVILGAMKRVKLKGDFRSNVSLGATAEKVKLTKEQEELACKAARVSKLPWCAVDIMPLVKGSNKELGDNVILELNASPGTDGISEVLETNFVNILLNELDNPKEFYLQNKVAGYLETVNIDFGNGGKDVLAKLDTGNGAHASHIEVGKMDIKDNKVSFDFDGHHYDMEIVDTSNAVTGSERHNRPIVIVPEITLGQRKVKDVPMALVESRSKSSNMLLNRECLSWLGYVVSPNDTHILTSEMEKINIV